MDWETVKWLIGMFIALLGLVIAYLQYQHSKRTNASVNYSDNKIEQALEEDPRIQTPTIRTNPISSGKSISKAVKKKMSKVSSDDERYNTINDTRYEDGFFPFTILSGTVIFGLIMFIVNYILFGNRSHSEVPLSNLLIGLILSLILSIAAAFGWGASLMWFFNKIEPTLRRLNRALPSIIGNFLKFFVGGLLGICGLAIIILLIKKYLWVPMP